MSMENPEFSSLLGKPKIEVGSVIKARCLNGDVEQLRVLLDLFLSPSNDIDDQEVIDWILWLVAGGSDPDEFASTVRLYDKATTCGQVWSENFVAYRCRTCGISEFMSLCTECFHQGNHEGHDFIIFRSETGGMCDCGETEVIKESGCCALHGPSTNHGQDAADMQAARDLVTSNAPADLLCVADQMMPQLFRRLITSMREEDKKRKGRSVKTRPFITCKHSVENNNEIVSSVLAKGHRFIKMLQQFSDMGVAMRQIMIHSLTKPHVYLESDPLMSKEPNPKFKTFLEELVYLTVKFELPEDLICLLLSMRANHSYKEEFTRAFILQYKLISKTIIESVDPEKLCKHVAAVSVQLFSSEQLAVKMMEEMNLVSLLVDTLHEMISHAILYRSKGVSDYPGVIDCDHEIMKNNYYWPIKSDLKEMLSHYPVAIKFMEDDDLLGRWMHFLSHFQGMNVVNYIEKGRPHVEHESETHISSCTAELEISSTPMWTLVSHLRDPSTSSMTHKIVHHCLNELLKWTKSTPILKGQVSFHLPLHRNLSMFIRQGAMYQGIPLQHLLPAEPSDLKVIAEQVIRLQTSFYQILGRLWPRNGTEILSQAESYVNSLCCNSMIDTDIFLLQALSGCMSPNHFLSLVFQEFEVYDYLGMDSSDESESEEQATLIENCLLFIAILATSRVNLDMPSEELIGLELSTVLSKGDKSHSELTESLPENCTPVSQPNKFEEILRQLAEFVAPRNLQQGKYVAKSLVWEVYYDPIHTLLRSSSRSEFQVSMDRYHEHIRRSNPSNKRSNLWPPFRVPRDVPTTIPDPRRLLLSNLMQEVIFVVLYKAVYFKNIPSLTIALAIHLFELAISIVDGLPSDQRNWVSSKLGIYNESSLLHNLTKKINLSVWFGDNTVGEESMISLLLQLLVQLSEGSSSIPMFGNGESILNENRVGEGSHFIGNLLSKIASTFPTVKPTMEMERVKLEVSMERSLDVEKEERKKRAEKRKLQLMTELAMNQQQFLKMNEETMSESVSKHLVLETENSGEPEYECVICMEKGVNKQKNPYGLIVTLSPSAVLAHRKAYDSYGLVGSSKGGFRDHWISVLQTTSENVDDEVVLNSFPVSGGVGVSIQTCGHHLHVDCFNAYLSSLKRSKCPSNDEGIHLNRKSFSCPLCRQLGNSFLPIIYDLCTLDLNQDNVYEDSYFLKAMKKRGTLTLSPKQKTSLDKFLEDIQMLGKAETFPFTTFPDTTRMVSSISTVLQNALEMDFLKSKTSDIQRSYLPPLVAALRYAFQSLPAKHGKKASQRLWETFIGYQYTKGKINETPLLLKDLNVLLTQFFMQLPLGTEQRCLKIAVHKFITLRFVQILVSLCLGLEKEELVTIENQMSSSETSTMQLVLHRILMELGKLRANDFGHYETDVEALVPSSHVSSLLRNPVELETFVVSRVKPFIKRVVFLCSRAFGCSGQLFNEFGETNIDISILATHQNFERSLAIWIEDLVQNKNFHLRDVSSSHFILWDAPRFIEIPQEYDKLFQHYRKEKCSNCGLVPNEPGLCLVCGRLVCLNSFCCINKQSKVSEVVQHSVDCGAGTGVFLCVLSSAVLLIVGKEACVWGSIFLDSFGEEDLDLRRGRPLYLCKERFQVLQKQWISNSFHRYELKWFPHDDML